MHFSTLLATTVGAALFMTAGARPTDNVQETSTSDPTDILAGNTTFIVQNFYANSNINNHSPEYHFYVEGHNEKTPIRSFKKTKCTVGAKFGRDVPNTLIAVDKGNCTDPNVTWRFRRYGEHKQQVGEYLEVAHHIPIPGNLEQ
jgi:hypothetical protein